MIVDDEPDVHKMTRFVLGDFTYMGKGLNFISAYSAKEARKLIEINPDTALILLDVVMEEDDSGLKLVTYIRETLKNNFVAIVLRTGQPGFAPQKDTLNKFDISDYKEKNYITEDELYSTLISSIRTFTDKYRLSKKIQCQELQLKEAIKRAESANIAKSAFLSTISHELKTPLTSISGFLEILEERFKKILMPNLININDQEIKEAINLTLEEIEIIATESATLTSLINELIDLSNIHSDSIYWEWEKINILSVFNNTALKIKPTANKKGLYLRSWQPGEQTPIYIWGDLEKITQVVTCLFDNAVKFTDTGGIVYTITKETEVVCCEVADTATAIASDKLDIIFEKFTQLADVLTNKSKGIGLGLSISKEIINIHNGCIKAAAKEGIGNSFSIILPIY
ncbi:MAG: hybrid sensor histidine kinase/response regulator [Nitrospirae bacterium]|nr:hybrid sensor histidine kinase/response regulator [Nitrospirota bacterium]